MDKAEAVAERARLQALLEGYEAGRLARPSESRGGGDRPVTPDRAGNVRERIARLDQLIAELDHD